MKYLGTMFGVHLYETKVLPENTMLIVPQATLLKAFTQSRTMEPNLVPREDLMKLVLGPKPDWIKEVP